MTINQITYFIATVENNTFMEAADALNLSQSSLSKSLMRLEEELEVKLFDRSKRTATLTVEGQVFYKGAQKILASYQETISELSEAASMLHGTIRLVTLPILAAYELTGILRNFKTQNKGIELIIDELEDNRIINALDEGTCDLAITRVESIQSDRYNYYPIATDELALVTSLTHPLSSRKEVSLSELSQESFLLMNKHISIYNICMDACKAYHFTPHVIRTARIESILSAVAMNEGVSLLMRKNLNMFNHHNVSIIPLKEIFTSTVVLATNKNKKVNHNTKSFIEYFTNQVKEFKA